jgi:hypothetical protein
MQVIEGIRRSGVGVSPDQTIREAATIHGARRPGGSGSRPPRARRSSAQCRSRVALVMLSLACLFSTVLRTGIH